MCLMTGGCPSRKSGAKIGIFSQSAKLYIKEFIKKPTAGVGLIFDSDS